MILRGVLLFLHGLSVFFFLHYLGFMHSLYAYSDWIFGDLENDSVFDYIIVGAGSAGSVIASKLAKARKKVLLLEAGEPPPFLADVPIFGPLMQGSKYDWKYVTEPQRNSCLGLAKNRSVWPMGKILGGSSRLNYMAYVRGHPKDYENWLPDFQEPTIDNGGSLNVESMKWSTVLSDAVVEGVKEMLQPVQDINEGTRTGFMKARLTQKDGRRWSTDRNLEPSDRLTVLTNAFVHKVTFDGQKATGVEFVKLDKKMLAFARKGVVVSAGAIGTPKLLMLSGIGPKNHLEELEIKVVADLPVGQNLVDHVLTGLDLVTLNTSLHLSISNILNPLSMLDYFIFGKGPWTFPGLEVVGTFHSDFSTDQSTSPDLQIMTLPGGISQDGGMTLGKLMGISDEIYQRYFAPLANANAITIAPILLHPKSTGEVKLRSVDPNDSPIINPNYLSDKSDVLTLMKGIDFVKKLVETESMKKLGAAIYERRFPGCEDKSFDTPDYWECYIRHVTMTVYHPGGTCRMGDVTDKSFRVYGIENLYIADASVLPVLPSGNINAAVVMLAEKAARLILQNVSSAKNQCHILDIFFLQ